MTKNDVVLLYKNIENKILDKSFLDKIGLKKKNVNYLMKKHKIKDKLRDLPFVNARKNRENVHRQVEQTGLNCESNVSMEKTHISCTDVFEILKDLLDELNSRPEPSWLNYINEYLITDIYPEKETFISRTSKEEYRAAVLLYVETLRVCLEFSNKKNPVWEGRELKFIRGADLVNSYYKEEYQKLKNISKALYVYEMMKISREINPFDTLAHISGVHYIAVHCGKQLKQLKKDVDLALVSGAAITHDIGKFGCNKKEISRIPYLHYYYTDQFCKRWGLNQISHIASNHSTWDLELENLSAESLLLIYSDFRVKSTWENGKEKVHFYSLEESFDVILSKLDNVDDKKEKRYRKVYAKLKDFENYMIELGVNVDLSASVIVQKNIEDVNVLHGMNVVNRLKFLAIEHNIKVMNQFNKESNFAGIIEAARSERDWKNLRSYLNIIKEYHTYMTKKQKQMTLKFTYELLQNREGDIRRDAAYLMGVVVTSFDEEYTKELPDGVILKIDAVNRFTIWKAYLEKIINPDYTSTIQQKRWIGYTLRIFIRTVLQNSNENDREKFIKIFLNFLKREDYDNLTTFILVETLNYIPLDWENFKDESSKNNSKIETVREFIKTASKRNDFEIDTALFKITQGRFGKRGYCRNNSEMFRENLKFDMPWIQKNYNIDRLVEKVLSGDTDTSVLQVGTHFANLLKVGDKVTVRHSAGRGLVRIMEKLSADERNELAIELTKGLEIGEYEYSKYIPEYLGKIAVTLQREDFYQLLTEIRRLIESRNEKVASVSLNTAGYILKEYQMQILGELDSTGSKGINQTRNSIENTRLDDERKKEEKERIMSMILRGLGDYRKIVSQEAFVVIGQQIFGDKTIPIDVKFEYFKYFYKKIVTLIANKNENTLTFYNNAAGLNHMYRFISDYLHLNEKMDLKEIDKKAFFPGTFDPFSLGHKEIAKKIRDLGFEVYLAIDEFSWSKKTQPHNIRRKIAMMSVADEENIYLFPENIPVNIASSRSIRNLKNTLKCENVYLAVGSDVVKNASSYKKDPQEDSIHTLNHIVFERTTEDRGKNSGGKQYFDKNISSENEKGEEDYLKILKGIVIRLKLPEKFSHISSTKIRENIDTNRDIGFLVDRVVQNYIYDKCIYMREPQYKSMAEIRDLRVGNFRRRKPSFLDKIKNFEDKLSTEEMSNIQIYMSDEMVKSVVIRSGKGKENAVAIAIAKEVTTSNLYDELRDFELTRKIRTMVRGKILIIGHIFVSDKKDYGDLHGILMTELLAAAMKDEFTYCIYAPILGKEVLHKHDHKLKNVLERYGFSSLKCNNQFNQNQLREGELEVMAVDMKNPVVLIQNIENFLKSPFNKDREVIKTMERTRIKLQESLRNMYSDNLILTVNSGLMQNKIIKLVRNKNKEYSEEKNDGKNGVDAQNRALGRNMAVPFGQIMKNTMIPNTVTKSIHMEKVFDPTVTTYHMIESKHYAAISNQVKTIGAFERPVILIDDIMHKGYKIQKLNPILKREEIEVDSIVAGIISANGRDIANAGGRNTQSAYFLPNLQAWFNESGQYPYIGEDAVIDRGNEEINYGSINLILPYAAPLFLRDKSKKELYQFSMTCLLNAKDIFTVIEKIYQEKFERKLTLSRLSEVFTKVSIPDEIMDKKWDDSKSPSDYIKEDIDRLHRLKGLI